MNGPMNGSFTSQKTKNKLHKKIFEKIKESKWGTFFKSNESNILETQFIFPIAIKN